jgi:hypothetical protein
MIKQHQHAVIDQPWRQEFHNFSTTAIVIRVASSPDGYMVCGDGDLVALARWTAAASDSIGVTRSVGEADIDRLARRHVDDVLTALDFMGDPLWVSTLPSSSTLVFVDASAVGLSVSDDEILSQVHEGLVSEAIRDDRPVPPVVSRYYQAVLAEKF